MREERVNTECLSKVRYLFQDEFTDLGSLLGRKSKEIISIAVKSIYLNFLCRSERKCTSKQMLLLKYHCIAFVSSVN